MLPAAQAARSGANVADAAATLAGRAVWNVSATAAGGGVAEMVSTMPGYPRAAGVNARWLVPACLICQWALNRNLPALLGMIRSQELVLLHDPQSAGLLSPLVQQNFPDDRHIGQPAGLFRTMPDGGLEGPHC
jgi:trehalose synthase